MMTRQEMAEGIIASAKTKGIILSTEDDQLVVEYLANHEPNVVLAELLRSCRADIVDTLKARKTLA